MLICNQYTTTGLTAAGVGLAGIDLGEALSPGTKAIGNNAIAELQLTLNAYAFKFGTGPGSSQEQIDKVGDPDNAHGSVFNPYRFDGKPSIGTAIATFNALAHAVSRLDENLGLRMISNMLGGISEDVAKKFEKALRVISKVGDAVRHAEKITKHLKKIGINLRRLWPDAIENAWETFADGYEWIRDYLQNNSLIIGGKEISINVNDWPLDITGFLDNPDHGLYALIDKYASKITFALKVGMDSVPSCKAQTAKACVFKLEHNVCAISPWKNNWETVERPGDRQYCFPKDSGGAAGAVFNNGTAIEETVSTSKEPRKPRKLTLFTPSLQKILAASAEKAAAQAAANQITVPVGSIARWHLGEKKFWVYYPSSNLRGLNGLAGEPSGEPNIRIATLPVNATRGSDIIPLTQTWWFWGIVGVAVAGTGYGVYRRVKAKRKA